MAKLYKFKDCDNMGRLISLLSTNEFYCSDFRQLNDPMEGAFDVACLNSSDKTYISECCKKIYDEKTKKRILSLTVNKKSIYMWAHYAKGFTGVAIEVSIDNREFKNARNNISEETKTLFKVNYTKKIESLDQEMLSNCDRSVYKALTTKLQDWKVEKEYRYIQDNQKKVLPITNVLLGMRIDADAAREIKKVCAERKISISQTCVHRPTSLVEDINLGIPNFNFA